MKRSAVLLAALSLCFVAPHTARAQALPTATLPTRITVFAGGSYVATRLYHAKNVAITAGANYSFPEFFHVHPAVELRGSLPISKGTDAGGNTGVGEKNFLGGVRLVHHIGRLHPYGDVLFGRGSLDYPTGGYFSYDGSTDYSYTSSAVIAVGGGIDMDLNSSFAVKIDGQYENYKTPVTQSGSLDSIAGTVAVVYRFDFDRHRHNREKPLPKDYFKKPKGGVQQQVAAPAPAPPTP